MSLKCEPAEPQVPHAVEATAAFAEISLSRAAAGGEDVASLGGGEAGTLIHKVYEPSIPARLGTAAHHLPRQQPKAQTSMRLKYWKSRSRASRAPLLGPGCLWEEEKQVLHHKSMSLKYEPASEPLHISTAKRPGIALVPAPAGDSCAQGGVFVFKAHRPVLKGGCSPPTTRFRGGLEFKAHRLVYHSTLRLHGVGFKAHRLLYHWQGGCRSTRCG